MVCLNTDKASDNSIIMTNIKKILKNVTFQLFYLVHGAAVNIEPSSVFLRAQIKLEPADGQDFFFFFFWLQRQIQEVFTNHDLCPGTR